MTAYTDKAAVGLILAQARPLRLGGALAARRSQNARVAVDHPGGRRGTHRLLDARALRRACGKSGAAEIMTA